LKKLSAANINKNGNGNFDKLELDELIDYIVSTHHSYVAKMLPIVNTHAGKVFNAHGKNHLNLLKLLKSGEL